MIRSAPCSSARRWRNSFHLGIASEASVRYSSCHRSNRFGRGRSRYRILSDADIGDGISYLQSFSELCRLSDPTFLFCLPASPVIACHHLCFRKRKQVRHFRRMASIRSWKYRNSGIGKTLALYLYLYSHGASLIHFGSK